MHSVTHAPTTVNTTKRLVDPQAIIQAVDLLAPGQVYEARILDGATGPNGYPATWSGYFDNPTDLLRELQKIKRALGIYITLQRCDPGILHRAKNRLVKQQKSGGGTKDPDITRYAWLPIDCDPKRAAGISSTDEEHAAALACAQEIREELTRLGWPMPIEADSGNGAHLLYKIDLPACDKDLVERVLARLAAKFGRPEVIVDKGNGNPARIWKLYGTLACKGDDTPERPHRHAGIFGRPGHLFEVSRDLLEAMATVAPVPDQRPAQPRDRSRAPGADASDLSAWIARLNIDTGTPEPYEGGTKWKVKACPFCAESGGAALFQLASGAWAYKCHHNRCAGKNWQDFRAHYEPGAYDRQPPPVAKKKNRIEEYDPDELGIDLCAFSADDAGNGDAMYALFGQDYLYCAEQGWLRYTGTYWSRDLDGATVKCDAVETLRKRRHAGVDAEAESIIKCSKADEKRVNGCINRFRTLCTVSILEFDSDPDVLNCQNGVVDLRTGQIEPHSREQRFTYCLAIPYNPQRKDCSLWLDYLNGVVGGGQDIINYLQMAAGYSITGQTREEVLFYLWGPSRSGKGTFAETLMHLIPKPLATMVDFNSFTAKRDGDVSNFDLAPLKPSRMIFASESIRNQALNPAKIKQLTGGDHVSCCFKHKDFFSYRPQFKVWMLSNHPVNGDPEDDALWGRVRVIEFPNSFLGREDKGKKARLKDPDVLESVLYWAVQGAMKWYALGAAGLPTPTKIAETTRAHRDELDYVQQWLDTCCKAHADAWTRNEDVIASYVGWCEANNIQHPKGPQSLSHSLKLKGYQTGVQRKINGRNGRWVVGLAILPSPETPGNDPVTVTIGNECFRDSPFKENTIETSQIHSLPIVTVTGSLPCENSPKEPAERLNTIPVDKRTDRLEADIKARGITHVVWQGEYPYTPNGRIPTTEALERLRRMIGSLKAATYLDTIRRILDDLERQVAEKQPVSVIA